MFARFLLAAPLVLSACAAAPSNLAAPVSETASPQAFPASGWAQACEDWDEWDKPGPPFRLSGSDTYYVGTCGIAAILIDSGAGLVLIDSGTDAGARVVMANIERLGFALPDVKYLLTSHEHFDHVGGIARIQQATGAQLITSAGAAEVFASGAVSPEDPQFGTIDGVSPARVDRVVGHGDEVVIGNKRLRALATPGHTHGALSWAWDSVTGPDQVQTVVYADSLSPVSADDYRFSDHPAYLASYREGIARIANAGRCLLATPHPSASQMRDRLHDWGLGMAGRDDCAQYAASITARLDARLAEEQRAQP